jgi:outer membrane protein assembly factor BamB
MSDLLYIGCNGFVAAIDPETGDERWRTPLVPGLLSETTCEDVCVLEHQGQVFAGCHGNLFCLDGAKGRILWRNELRGMGFNDVTLSIAGKSAQAVGQPKRD